MEDQLYSRLLQTIGSLHGYVEECGPLVRVSPGRRSHIFQHLFKVVKDINVLLGYLEEFQQWQEGERLKDPLLRFPRPQPISQSDQREKGTSPTPERNASSDSDRESRDEMGYSDLRASALGRSVQPSQPPTPYLSPAMERKRKRLSGEIFRGPELDAALPGSRNGRITLDSTPPFGVERGFGVAPLLPPVDLGTLPQSGPIGSGVVRLGMGETMTTNTAPQAPEQMQAESEPVSRDTAVSSSAFKDDVPEAVPSGARRVTVSSRALDRSNRYTVAEQVLETIHGQPRTFDVIPDGGVFVMEVECGKV